jgi:glycosyltransferase involved in cell wall biosynthesis
MKVLFVHNFYQQFGGEDSAAIAERNLLESHGDEVLCFTRHNDEIKSYSLWDKAAFIPRTMYSHRTERELRQAVEDFAPNVAFVHNVYPLISPSLYHTLHSLRVPIVQVVHDFRPFCPNGWFYIDGQICERCKFGNYLHAVKHRCYKDSYILSALYSASLAGNRMAGMTDKVAAYVCLTNFYRQKMLEVGLPENKIFIRPNFIDPSAFAPDRSSPGSGEYALYLGRLSSEKGPLTVLRAFEKLADVPLKIVGTGPLEAEMKQYIRDKDLRNVEMVGFKSGADKWQLIKNALFAIIPSECYENFPMVSLEYFSGGKPIIASNLGGLPHIVEEGKTGMLYRPGDVDHLVEKIRCMLARPAQIAEMGKRGRELAETRYGPEESYSSLMNIFAQVRCQ